MLRLNGLENAIVWSRIEAVTSLVPFIMLSLGMKIEQSNLILKLIIKFKKIKFLIEISSNYL